jgi:O-antigen biosynthesis protein
MSRDPPLNSLIRDVAVQSRQLIRDLGITPVAARQLAKLILRAAAVGKAGTGVEGMRRRAECDYSMAVPFYFENANPSPERIRIAVVCHMFHPELSSEFREALANIPGQVNVTLSTDTDEKRIEISRVFNDWKNGSVDVRVVANRGRDIGPKLTAYNDVYGCHDLVLFVHSKRNIHLVDGSDWRRYLLHTLVGSPAIVGSILEAFHRDPLLGIVMPQHWAPIRSWVDWSNVFVDARNLARRMGVQLSPAHVIDFPSGSMFWARPAALRPILDLRLQMSDFPDEAGRVDGTPAHAVERLFLFACEVAGYRWAKICDPNETIYPEAVIPIDTSLTLDAYYLRYGYRLLAL